MGTRVRFLAAVTAMVAAGSATALMAPTPAVSLTAGTYLVAANGSRPALSATGRYVAFVSPDRLLPADTNTFSDAYVRDVQTGRSPSCPTRLAVPPRRTSPTTARESPS